MASGKQSHEEHRSSPPRSWIWSALLLIWTVLLVLVSLLPQLRVDYWWVRAWSFPRLQLLAVCVVSVIAMLAWRPRSRFIQVLAVLLGLASLWQLSWIYRYTPLAPRPVTAAERDRPADHIRIVSVNVLQANDQFEQVIKTVEDVRPDVLIAVETNQRWVDRLRPLNDDFPHRVAHPQDNGYGMILYSRLPIAAAEVRFLVEPHIPSLHCRLQLRSGREILLFAVHPAPPKPSAASGERDEELIRVGRLVQAAGAPAIVAGDLNDVGWSPLTQRFQRVSGLLDPRHGRGIYATYHADYPLLRYPLDYLFHTRDFHLVQMKVLGHVGSDHFPLLVELQLSPAGPGGSVIP